MPTDHTKRAPLAIQLEVEFLDRLSEPVRDGKAKSVSGIIREAVERFDFSNVLVMHPAQLQISVRLPEAIRRTLRKVARAKHTSIGHLVRAAVEAYLPRLEAQATGQLEMPIAPEPFDESGSVGSGSGARERPMKPRRRKTRLARRTVPAKKKRGAMTKKRKG
jgi:Arc/MetJ-type ribon-helix-helix transcriptional regulator